MFVAGVGDNWYWLESRFGMFGMIVLIMYDVAT